MKTVSQLWIYMCVHGNIYTYIYVIHNYIIFFSLIAGDVRM